MFRTFFMKYKYPLAYVATKILANHIHAGFVPRERMGAGPTKDWQRKMLELGRDHTPAEREACIREIAMGLPRIRVADQSAPAREDKPPIYEARSATPVQRPFFRESHNVWIHRSARPAAVKANGGLRGSTATKSR